MCDFHSLSYSCISWSCLRALFLWNLRTDISDPFEEYRAKGNILRSKWERSFLRNFFVICEFISQCYSLPLKKPFAKTVLVEFAKGYLEALRGQWWKRKYPPMKTGKKLSENMLLMCDFHSLRYTCISWSCLLAFFLWNLRTDISDRFEEYPQIKTRKKFSEKLLCDLWIHRTELHFCDHEAVC